MFEALDLRSGFLTYGIPLTSPWALAFRIRSLTMGVLAPQIHVFRNFQPCEICFTIWGAWRCSRKLTTCGSLEGMQVRHGMAQRGSHVKLDHLSCAKTVHQGDAPAKRQLRRSRLGCTSNLDSCSRIRTSRQGVQRLAIPYLGNLPFRAVTYQEIRAVGGARLTSPNPGYWGA